MDIDLANIIFGMKVRQARTETGLTLTQFAKESKLSASYVTDIERGRKYPRANKIMRMADVLGKSYDDLVSIKLDSSLAYLEAALKSPLIQQFPFDEFGLDMTDVVNLLTRAPDKASALLHSFLEVGRYYDMQDEHFLRAALRSYQELHENYFPDLETAAQEFAKEHELEDLLPIPSSKLETILQEEYGYQLDYDLISADAHLKHYRSVFVPGSNPTLFINKNLHPNQIRFLLGRELGYCKLKLRERSITSTPHTVESFQQVHNDFKASYFSGALLMPEAAMEEDLSNLFGADTYNNQYMLDMLDHYDVTPEMLLYRFSELVPQMFGVALHFLRLQRSGGDRYYLIKHLNMNRLSLPSGGKSHTGEHHCRRWLTVRLLHELQKERESNPDVQVVAGAQVSEFLDEADRRFLCIGFARPFALSPDTDSCVIVGFRVDRDLRETIKFADDPSISTRVINDTCERCPLSAEQCQVRAAEPTILQEQQRDHERNQALKQLRAQVRS